jgi:hypothetical protein
MHRFDGWIDVTIERVLDFEGNGFILSKQFIFVSGFVDHSQVNF